MGLTQTIPPYAEPISLVEAKAHLRVDFTDDDAYIGALISNARAHVESETHTQLVTATWLLQHRYLARRKILLPIAPAQSIDIIQFINLSGVLTTIDTSVYQLLYDRFPGVVVLQYLQIWPTTIRNQENDAKITYKAGFVTPFTANATTDMLTAQGRTFALNDMLRLSNSGGGLPAPLAALTDYYIINPANGGASFQLALTQGGAAIDITTAGTGTQFAGYPTNFAGGTLPPQAVAAMKLLISHWYENREGTADKPLTEIPRGVDSLLTNIRVVEFE